MNNGDIMKRKKRLKMVPGKGLTWVDVEEETENYYEPHTWYPLKKAIDLLEGKGVEGIYWIRLAHKAISYPKGKSQVIYIGKSERSIRQRLKRHLEGRDPQGACILSQSPAEDLEVGFELIPQREEIFTKEQLLLKAFRKRFGDLPQCNRMILR